MYFASYDSSRICLPIHIYLSVCLYLSSLSLSLSVCLSVCLSVSPSIYLTLDLSIYLSFCLSVFLSSFPFLSFPFLSFPSSFPSFFLSFFLSFFFSFFLSLWQLFSFLFLLFHLFALQRRKPNKEASKQARAAHLRIWCAAGGDSAPPPTLPAPRNLHLISNTRACHEINILRWTPRCKNF